MTPCHACPLRKKPLFVPMTQDEISYMAKFKAGELTVDAGTQILLEGANSPQLFTVLSGFGLRYKTLRDGERQVLNFVLPGAFLGMQAGIMGEMRHSVEATSRMTMCVFNRKDIWPMFRSMPERAFDLTWMAAVEENFLGEALATIGQLTASQRIAWALVRLFTRAQALGLAPGNTMPLPYRQQDMADALGLSLVHTNKTLSRFRDRQLAVWSNGTLRINDLDALSEIAGMDDAGDPITRPLM